ncbi:MAG: anaerobic C4-dicarboxylate transporter, partial [Aeromonas sp.]
MIYMEFLVVIGCLLLGTRFGGMGLGLISGIGLFILTFIFGLTPGTPPVQVMLTILAVIGCAATLQTAGGLNVMMQVAERLLRRHPQYITVLAPLTTWTLTFLCGTGHVVYTLFPIIADIALKKDIRPERPMAVASVASQMAICASPVSVAVVSMVSMLAAHHGLTTTAYGLLDILTVAIPASLTGVFIAALWSLRRGQELSADAEFQAKINDPLQRAFIYGGGDTLLKQTFPKQAYWSTWLFFAAIAVVVALGAYPELRPVFTIGGKTAALSMNLVIQMLMLIAGALILIFCQVKQNQIANSAVFKAGMVAIFSVFGVAWMSETFFQAHMALLKGSLADIVQSQPWTYALVLFLVSKLVNSQAAALAAIAPMGLALGVDPKLL